MVFFILGSVLILPVLAAGSTTISLASSGSTIRIGDTITVTGNFNGSMVGTFDINVTYNAAQLKFVSASRVSPAIIADDDFTAIDRSGSTQILYVDADGGLSGITSGGAFKIKFTVIGGNVGDTVSVGTQITAIGDSDAAAMQASTTPATMTIAAPLSGNTFLSGLTIDNGTLSPAFSKSVYQYSVTVPFRVEKLNVTATAEDATSRVTINSPALAAGGTTEVAVTVSAQSGAKKTYVIEVVREKDPNYKASGNANLKSLTPNNGILSPAFTPDGTTYVIYLPYEITSFNATGEMEDGKAQGAVCAEIKLELGENLFTITGKSEDGTEKVYTIKVNRMPSTSGSSSEAASSSATAGFQITISGILTDDLGNPLAGKTVELHSDPQITTTDAKGFYQFKNVTEGAHTLFIKEKDGTELAKLPIVITKGEVTSVKGNEIVAKGNTTIDLSLKKDGLTVKDVAETAAESAAASNGVPIYLVIIMVLFALGLGGAGGYFLFGNSRLLYAKKPINEDAEESHIVM